MLDRIAGSLKQTITAHLSPRIGTFGQTDTLGDLIDRPSPALLSLFHSVQRGIPGFGYLGRDVRLDVMSRHHNFNGLTRTRQRFRCLEVGNGLSAVFFIQPLQSATVKACTPFIELPTRSTASAVSIPFTSYACAVAAKAFC